MKPVSHVCPVSRWIKYETIPPASYTFIMWYLVKQGDSCTLLEVFSCCWVILHTPKLLWSVGGGIQFKIMLFLSTGTSGKMPFQVVMNENVYIASAHHPWGCHWLLQIKEEEGWLLSCGLRTAYGREEPVAFIFYPDSGRTFLWNTDTSLLDSMESCNKNVRSHKMPEVSLCDASHLQRTLLAKVGYRIYTNLVRHRI